MRVNIEDRCFGESRTHRLAQEIGFQKAIGLLACLWHESQEELKPAGTKEEILVWVRAKNKKEAEKQFELLIKYRFIKIKIGNENDDLYEIVGNSIQIENILEKIANSKKGGKATKEKWEQYKAAKLLESKKAEGYGDGHPSGLPLGVLGLGSNQTNTNQANTNQANTKHSNPKQTNANHNIARGTSDHDAQLFGTEVLSKGGESIATWDAYSHAYEKRYGAKPVRNAKVNGMLSQFVKRLGVSEAPLVAAFYLTHNDSYYVKNGHQINLMLQNAEKLRMEWFTGQKITGTKANQIERFENNLNSFARAAEILDQRKNGGTAKGDEFFTDDVIDAEIINQ